MASNILYPTLPWLDDVLGGGLAKGGTYYIHGQPGVGKTTLAVQALVEVTCNRVGCHPPSALFLSGEQSAAAFAGVLGRIRGAKSSNFHFLSQRNVDETLGILRVMRPEVVVIDAVQTVFSSEDGDAAHDASRQLQRVRQAAGEYATVVFLSHDELKPKRPKKIADFDAAFLLSALGDGVVEMSTVKNRFEGAKLKNLYMSESGFIPMIGR